MKKIMLSCCFFLFQFFGFTQVQKDNQFNSWFTYSGNHKMNEKYSIHTLYSFRRNDFVKNWQQSLLRLGINREIKENLIVTLGYDWVETFPYGEQPIAKQETEHRPFEQIILKNAVGRFKITHRYRLEQRFIENNSTYLFRNRLRYRFILTVPLNHKKMGGKTFYFAAFDELFISVGKSIGSHYFNQNWAYLGIGYQFNEKTKMSIGYMNQYLPKNDDIRIENNHTLNIGFSHSFDFSNKNDK